MDKRYQTIIADHGEGGFGKVSIAMDTILDRKVAVKKLLYPDEANIGRFKKEAKILAKLSNPYIPSIYDVLFEENEFFLYCEFISGNNLRFYIEQGIFPSVDDVKRWFTQIALALDSAHKEGIIHRDIKPENIIISEGNKTASLVDFGIALNSEDTRNLKKRGYIIGTPGYLAPEIIGGQDHSEASDYFSLGVTLYEVLSGTHPVAEIYQDLSDKNEAIPPAIDELIKACITADKNSRIKDAAEFIHRLQNALRSDVPLSALLTDARLHEIHSALTRLSPDEYHVKPIGQKLLILNRVKDLVRTQVPIMKKPTAEMINVLLYVAMLENENNYKPIVDAALLWGLEISFGSDWQGDQAIRESLISCSKSYSKDSHTIASKSILQFVQNYKLSEKPKWWLHVLRSIVMALLANPNGDLYAEELATLYDEINKYSHSVSPEKFEA